MQKASLAKRSTLSTRSPVGSNARDHLVAENAKIGGFLMNPSQ